MATINGYTLKIITNNQPTKIIDYNNSLNTSILKGSKYSLELSNYNEYPVDAYLKIDGKKLGAYRIIPYETISIIRPSLRRKDLCFLEKSEEFSQQHLFKETNKKLGEVEVIFRNGEKYDSDEEDIYYTYNKQIFRLDTYDFNPDYMNRYKRKIYKKKNLSENEEVLKENIFIETCSPFELIEKECCPEMNCNIEVPSESNLEVSPTLIESYNSNGFTAYGDNVNSKYKTYQALNYNSEETKIIINLFIKKYESL